MKWSNINNIFNGAGYTIGLTDKGDVITGGVDQTLKFKKFDAIKDIAFNHNSTVAVGVREDGTVLGIGTERKGDLAVDKWHNIEKAVKGYNYTAGLRNDGTVIGCGDSNNFDKDISAWSGIVDIIAFDYFIVGLKKDGTIVHSDHENLELDKWSNVKSIYFDESIQSVFGITNQGGILVYDYGEEHIGRQEFETWKNIVTLAAAYNDILGIKRDGSVVGTGINDDGELDIIGENNINDIKLSQRFAVGLKKDGTIVYTGKEIYPGIISELDKWENIKSISISEDHVVGLKEDGTMLAVGKNTYEQLNVGKWTDIKKIHCTNYHTIGLTSSGQILVAGNIYNNFNLNEIGFEYAQKEDKQDNITTEEQKTDNYSIKINGIEQNILDYSFEKYDDYYVLDINLSDIEQRMMLLGKNKITAKAIVKNENREFDYLEKKFLSQNDHLKFDFYNNNIYKINLTGKKTISIEINLHDSELDENNEFSGEIKKKSENEKVIILDKYDYEDMISKNIDILKSIEFIRKHIDIIKWDFSLNTKKNVSECYSLNDWINETSDEEYRKLDNITDGKMNDYLWVYFEMETKYHTDKLENELLKQNLKTLERVLCSVQNSMIGISNKDVEGILESNEPEMVIKKKIVNKIVSKLRGKMIKDTGLENIKKTFDIIKKIEGICNMTVEGINVSLDNKKLCDRGSALAKELKKKQRPIENILKNLEYESGVYERMNNSAYSTDNYLNNLRNYEEEQIKIEFSRTGFPIKKLTITSVTPINTNQYINNYIYPFVIKSNFDNHYIEDTFRFNPVEYFKDNIHKFERNLR